MSEVTDIVLPILQRIQTELADLKRQVISLDGRVDAMSESFAKIESYITYSLGLISQNKADLDRQGRALLEIGRRVEALEHQS